MFNIDHLQHHIEHKDIHFISIVLIYKYVYIYRERDVNATIIKL